MKQPVPEDAPSAPHLLEKMLLADSADLADVVDKADVPFRCSVALTDTDVSEPLQEVSPGVGPYPVPQGQAHLMVAVLVALHDGGGKR